MSGPVGGATLRSPVGVEAPGPRSLFTFFAWKRDRLGFLAELQRVHGDIAAFRAGGERFVLVSHPEPLKELLVTRAADFTKGRTLERAKALLGEGLLTSEGERHRQERLRVQPALHSRRLPAYASAMVALTEEAARAFAPGRETDLHRDLVLLTLRIVARTLFGSEGAEAREVGEAFADAHRLFAFYSLPFADSLARLPLPAVRRLRRARRRLDAVVYRLIDERISGAEDRGDLLSQLIRAPEGSGGPLDRERIRDEVVTLFLAGHETTANALTFTFLELARNPAVAGRLREEVRALLGGRPATFEDLPRLSGVERVFAEAIRLHPPVHTFGRRAAADTCVGGYRLARGTIALVSPFVLHRDRRFFAEPDRFLPDRFLPEAVTARPPLSYLPFGAGPRRCAGEAFAWMEGVLVIATLLARWRFRVLRPQAVVHEPLLTLKPRGGLPVVPEALTESYP